MNLIFHSLCWGLASFSSKRPCRWSLYHPELDNKSTRVNSELKPSACNLPSSVWLEWIPSQPSQGAKTPPIPSSAVSPASRQTRPFHTLNHIDSPRPDPPVMSQRTCLWRPLPSRCRRSREGVDPKNSWRAFPSLGSALSCLKWIGSLAGARGSEAELWTCLKHCVF